MARPLRQVCAVHLISESRTTPLSGSTRLAAAAVQRWSRPLPQAAIRGRPAGRHTTTRDALACKPAASLEPSFLTPRARWDRLTVIGTIHHLRRSEPPWTW
jgi:hypothetical protein